MKFAIPFLFCLLNLVQCRYLYDNDNDGVEVKHIIRETSSGLLKGKIMETFDQKKTFYAFQSIPFAEPPLNNLRFMNPVAPSNWTGVRDATQSSKYCIQGLISPQYISEDCLYLNVFTPTLNSTALLPVIFWVHGGFFLIGNGNIDSYHPDLFINEDIVFVSVNYRMGVFGFLSNEDDVLPGNYGLRDQIMALKWVHENIAQFGGNSSRVTLMGQSAGAATIALLLQSTATQGLYSAAIMESGNSLNLWSRTRDPKVMVRKIASNLKIDYNSTNELLSKLKDVDLLDLIEATTVEYIWDALESSPINGLPFGPTYDEEFPEYTHQKLERGEFNHVPVLTGYNTAEGGLVLPILDSLRIYFYMYNLEPSLFAPIDLNVNNTVLRSVGKIVKQYYFGKKNIDSSKALLANFLTDHEFLRPVQEFVRLISNYTRTYLYRFEYIGNLPSLPPVFREIPGTTHGEEIPYIFYSPNENTPDDEDELTRRRMVKMWTNFAKYHNPTPNDDPVLQNITWQPVSAADLNFLDIDKNLTMMKQPRETAIKFWQNIYQTYGHPPFDTY